MFCRKAMLPFGSHQPPPEEQEGAHRSILVQGYLAHKKQRPQGAHSRNMPRALWRPYGGGAVSYERGTPAEQQPPQGVFVCDHAGLVINKSSLSILGTLLSLLVKACATFSPISDGLQGYRAYSNRRSHTFEQSVCVTLNLRSTEKQSVCVSLNDLKSSKVRERRVCADLEFSTSTCTTKTRDRLGSPLLDP